MNINESQNRQDKQCTDKEKENDCDLSSALSEESNSQKSAGKYILIVYLNTHLQCLHSIHGGVYYIHFPRLM